MQCFRCDQKAVQECPRCGALYCDDHGDALCARCADPVLAVPSYRVFRGSLLALLVGSLVAVWLLVLPPAGADQDRPPTALAGIVPTAGATPRPSSTPSPASTAAASATGTPRPTGTPTATPTPTATATARPAATSTPAAATPAPPPAVTTYTVRPGDNLTGIAAQFNTTVDALQRANNISDPSQIQAGDRLTIPR
ncbi:MAG: LysM domain-containing protein [Dehalococcoidia bacterium]|nr:LysM domain-containing protein [Dehalococcoidia bacterium]